MSWASMNVRHYLAIFDDASWHLSGGDWARPGGIRRHRAWLGGRAPCHRASPRGEGAVGVAAARRASGIVRVGRTSLTYRHVMHGVPDAVEHATMEVVTVFFDLAARAAAPSPWKPCSVNGGAGADRGKPGMNLWNSTPDQWPNAKIEIGRTVPTRRAAYRRAATAAADVLQATSVRR